MSAPRVTPRLRLTGCLLCPTLLAVPLIAAIPRSQTPAPPGGVAPAASVVVEHNPARNETTVRWREQMSLTDTPERSLALAVSATYDGPKTDGQPRDVTLMLASLSRSGYQLPPVSLLMFVADDRHLPGRRTARLVANVKDGTYVEAIAAILPNEMFAVVANAARLTATIHETNIEFTPVQLERLRAFAATIHLGTSGPVVSSSPVAENPHPVNPQRSANIAVGNSAASDESLELNRRLLQLYHDGEFAKAIPIGERMIELVGKESGLESAGMATALNNVALIRKSMGDYEEAERLYRRVLDILKKLSADDTAGAAVALGNPGTDPRTQSPRLWHRAGQLGKYLRAARGTRAGGAGN
jgi:hypothetical protein